MFIEQIIQPGLIDEYIPVIMENACASAQEPGCVRFDVMKVADKPESVFLFEYYKDEAAFQAHRASAHYAKFMEKRDRYVKESRRTFLTTME
jgi:quinol monooxygenase YgiN